MRLAAGFRESLETPTRAHTHIQNAQKPYTQAAGAKAKEWVKRKKFRS